MIACFLSTTKILDPLQGNIYAGCKLNNRNSKENEYLMKLASKIF